MGKEKTKGINLERRQFTVVSFWKTLMLNQFFCTVLLVWTIGGITLIKQENPYLISDELICPYDLVKAEVVETKEIGSYDQLQTTFKIIYVFKGSPQLQGQTFTLLSSKLGPGTHRVVFLPEFTPGEVDLWMVRTVKGTLQATSMGEKYGGLPSRKGVPRTRYPQVEAWAAIIEATLKVEPAERLDLLKKFTLSTTPEVSTWAVNVLSQAKPQGMIEFFHKLVSNQEFSLAGQVTLDQVLLDTEPDHWKNSPERTRLIENWGTQNLNEYEVSLVLYRLNVLSQHGDLDDKVFLAVIKAITDNPKLSSKERCYAIQLVGWIPYRGRDTTLAFDFLTQLIQESHEKDVIQRAIYCFKDFTSLNKQQMDVVRMLQKKVNDEELNQDFQDLLNRFENPKK